MKNLYFIGLLAPEPVYSETREFQQHIADTYQSKAALKPPPHITLIPPFSLEGEMEAQLFKYTDKVASSKQPFEISVDGFGSFSVGVIYETVILSKDLKSLEYELSHSFYGKFKLEHGPAHAYVPHITIAYKDLSPIKFPKAWEEFKDKIYRRKWTADKISILKSTPRGWQSIHESKFGMEKEGDTMALF